MLSFFSRRSDGFELDHWQHEGLGIRRRNDHHIGIGFSRWPNVPGFSIGRALMFAPPFLRWVFHPKAPPTNWVTYQPFSIKNALFGGPSTRKLPHDLRFLCLLTRNQSATLNRIPSNRKSKKTTIQKYVQIQFYFNVLFSRTKKSWFFFNVQTKMLRK